MVKKALIPRKPVGGRWDREKALGSIYGDDVKVVYADHVIESMDEFTDIINEGGVVAIDTDIITRLLLAELLLTTEFANSVDLREPIMVEVLSDDKTRYESEFRQYSKPLIRVKFVERADY